MRWISLIASGHSTQMQKNTPFQMHMEHSPGETTSWVTNQTSVKSRKWKSYQASSTTRYQLQGKKCKKHKNMEIKQHISK